MLGQIEEFRPKLAQLGFSVTTPSVIQTLNERELIELVPHHDGWIIGDDPATFSVLSEGKNGRLRAIVKWGIGVDNVDMSAVSELGLKFSNTPGVFGSEVADLALCYLLGLARDAFYIDREVRKGNWVKPAGISVSGKTIGIIGMGDIGRSIARRAQAHELKVIGWDPYVQELPGFIELQEDWPIGLGRCDFLVFACALTPSNTHMFSSEVLPYLKQGVKVINVSRGPLIDETALVSGLESGLIASAALDVFESEPISGSNPLLTYPRCILGSHNASNTIEGVSRASDKAVTLLGEFLLDGS
jgi:D-3-phosphoglycerate dehydrogenase